MHKKIKIIPAKKFAFRRLALELPTSNGKKANSRELYFGWCSTFGKTNLHTTEDNSRPELTPTDLKNPKSTLSRVIGILLFQFLLCRGQTHQYLSQIAGQTQLSMNRSMALDSVSATFSHSWALSNFSFSRRRWTRRLWRASSSTINSMQRDEAIRKWISAYSDRTL